MRILVSGAGMAGLSAGITLGADGHDVTIVERANHLRVNGSPIDIRGDAIKVADKMGVLDEIRARRVDMSERVQFVDSHGELLAEMPDSEFNDCPDDTEIPREDLANVLRAALDPATSLRFGESIAELHDDGDGVDVRFASGDSSATTSWSAPTACIRPPADLCSDPRAVPATPRLLCRAGRSARSRPSPIATTRCTTSRAPGGHRRLSR